MSLYTVSATRILCRQDEPLPKWWPAGLKGLYRDRSLDKKSRFRSSIKSKICRWRTSFAKRNMSDEDSSAARDRARVENWIQASTDKVSSKPGWRVVKPHGDANARLKWCKQASEYSIAYSTSATVRQRGYLDSRESLTNGYMGSGRATSVQRKRSTGGCTNAFTASGTGRVAVTVVSNSSSSTEAVTRSKMGENEAKLQDESTTTTTSRDLMPTEKPNSNAVSVGMVMLSEERATSTLASGHASKTKGHAKSPSNTHISLLKDSHSLSRTSVATPATDFPQALVVAQEGLHPAAVSPAKRDRAERNSSHVSETLASSHDESQQAAPAMLPHGMQHGHAPSQATSIPLFQASTAAPSTIEHNANAVHGNSSSQVPLSALKHAPAKQRASSRRSKKQDQQTKKKRKVRYFYDTDRGVMVRRGLYDEGHRPKEDARNGIDLFRRIRGAGIWDKLVGWVIW